MTSTLARSRSCTLCCWNFSRWGEKDLSAAQAKALLTKARPRDLVGRTRRRLAAEPVTDLEQNYARRKSADTVLETLLAATRIR